MKKTVSSVMVLWTVLYALACHLSAQDLKTIQSDMQSDYPPDGRFATKIKNRR